MKTKSPSLPDATRLLSIVLLFLLSIHTLTAAPPNIIVVMPDDMGYGDLGCHGNPVIQTPHLDAFSRECVRFTDFHSRRRVAEENGSNSAPETRSINQSTTTTGRSGD